MPSMFRSKPLRQPKTRPKPLFRDSPRKRGYNDAWDRFSRNFRQRHPFCSFCEQQGRLRFCDVVDHKIPLAHGGELLDPGNTHGLCDHHHNGLKAQLEAHALATRQLDKLVEWCDNLSVSPTRFKAPCGA